MSYKNINDTLYCVPVLTDNQLIKRVGLDEFKVNSFNDYDYSIINFTGSTIPFTSINISYTSNTSTFSNIISFSNISVFYNAINNDVTLPSLFDVQQLSELSFILKSKDPYINLNLSGNTSAISIVNTSFTAKTEYEKNIKLDIFATTNPSVKNRFAAGYKFSDGNGNFTGNSFNKITSLNSIFNYKNEDDYVRFNMSSIYNTFFNNNILNGDSITNDVKWEPLNSVVMKVTESIDNVLVPKVNDFSSNTINNIFNLINAREINSQFQYNRDLPTLFSTINSSPTVRLYFISLDRRVNNSTTFAIGGDTNCIITFSNTLSSNFTLTGDEFGYELKIRIDKNFISTKSNFKSGLIALFDNGDFDFEYDFMREYNTFNSSLFIVQISTNCSLDDYSETGLFIEEFFNLEIKTAFNNFSTEEYGSNQIMDYNNNILLNNNGAGFIRTEEHTPIVTTMLNSFPDTTYRINRESQKIVALGYAGNGNTFYYTLNNEDTVLPTTASEDYNFLIQDSFTNSNILNLRLLNLINTSGSRFIISYIQNISCENFYDKKVFTLGWRNKFGTIGFISTTSRPVINISRNVSLNSTNKQYSTNSFINSPNTSTSLNRLIKREISSYNSNISFSLSFPFNNDTRHIMYDIIDSNYFILYEKNERTFSLNIESYSIENNILNLNLLYLDDEYTDKLLSILNEF